jgi:hypothetical protein
MAADGRWIRFDDLDLLGDGAIATVDENGRSGYVGRGAEIKTLPEITLGIEESAKGYCRIAADEEEKQERQTRRFDAPETHVSL